jgi:hypothetical protein
MALTKIPHRSEQADSGRSAGYIGINDGKSILSFQRASTSTSSILPLGNQVHHTNLVTF